VEYLGSYEHIFACAFAIAVLFFQLLYIPWYFYWGAMEETGNPGCGGCMKRRGTARGMQQEYDQLRVQRGKEENRAGNLVKRWQKHVKYKKLDHKKEDLKQVQLREQAGHMSDLKTQRTAALKAGDRERASALKKEILDVLYGKASDGTVSSTEEVSYCTHDCIFRERAYCLLLLVLGYSSSEVRS
jgi:hypothetical protein